MTDPIKTREATPDEHIDHVMQVCQDRIAEFGLDPYDLFYDMALQMLVNCLLVVPDPQAFKDVLNRDIDNLIALVNSDMGDGMVPPPSRPN